MATTRPNGKGDRPRKVNGPKYRDNYDNIKWTTNESKTDRNNDRPQSRKAYPQTPQQYAQATKIAK